MNDGGRADVLNALVDVWAAVEVVEEPLATAEQDGRDHQMHLIDQAGAQVLLDGGRRPMVRGSGRTCCAP